jgi:hypothetical protein
MERINACLILAGMMALISFEAKAKVYSWEDDRGIVHFTNLPPASELTLRKTERKHVFFWQDDIGALRRIHRIDVDRFDPIIEEAALYYQLPQQLIKAVIAVESAFSPRITSAVGAQGLMQLMPKTATLVGVSDPLNPRANIFGGSRYLRLMANQFEGDVLKTIASYNAGPDAVITHRGTPPFEQTQTFVRRVLKFYIYYLENGKKRGMP